MRKVLFSYISFALFPCFAQQQQKNLSVPIPSGSTVNFSFSVNNTYAAKSDNSINTVTTQIEKRTDDSAILKKFSELRSDLQLPQSIKDWLNPLQFISRYKWHLFGLSLLASYSTLCYCIISGNAYLGNNDLWSSWHQELPMDQLLAIPQHQFAQDLLHEIQRRYTDPGSLTDLIQPLSLFIKNIEHEEEQIKWYQSFYSWASYLKLAKLVPLSQQRFSQITARLQRIAYYKNVFKSWAAQYQLEHSPRALQYMASVEATDVSDMAQKMRAALLIRTHDYWLKKRLSVTPSYSVL